LREEAKMKFNYKDIILCFFILVFLAEGVAYFRLNKLEKATHNLEAATSGLYEIYTLDRRLNELEDLKNNEIQEGGGLFPIYPLPRKPS
jgi:hypothetical protein